MDETRDVLNLLLTYILKAAIGLVANLIVHDLADANPARLGKSLQT